MGPSLAPLRQWRKDPRDLLPAVSQGGHSECQTFSRLSGVSGTF